MHIVIIGNGIAGSTAARFIRKQSEHRITMISNETMQPFSRTALMYVYMGHMPQASTHLYEDDFWAKNKIERKLGQVVSISTVNKTLNFDDGSQLDYDKLIVATGSKPKFYHWPGQQLKGVQGLYHLQDLETLETYSKDTRQAVVVGGGLIGVELAEMLHSRGIEVHFLIRESSFWRSVLPQEESEMIGRHLGKHGIHLHVNTELEALIDDGTGRVSAVRTTAQQTISCQFAGISVGVEPNIAFLANSGIETQRGVLVNQKLQTNDPHVFAIGDCAQLQTPQAGRRDIEAIWYTGRMMGQTVAATICAQPTDYQPKTWFNSAKFFDIEYQTYGQVPANTPNGTESLYWQHPQKDMSVRINFDAQTQQVSGFNLMGIRFRHEVCERWIDTKTDIETVLSQLALANFDPEFSAQFDQQIIQQYNQKYQKQVQLQTQRSASAVRRFLQKLK